jgi:Na+/H+ antiporter NhaD/arsenite permease-like protein
MKFNRNIWIMVAVLFMLKFSVVFAQTDSVNTAARQQPTITQAADTVEHAAAEEHGGLGAELPIWSVIPFIGILLSIAIFPIVAPHFWHHHYGKVSLFWALLFGVPFFLSYGIAAFHETLHIYLLEYIPFIILLWSLFTVSAGLLAKGAPVGTPMANLILLIIGTAIASWIGTTGASMVLIRPLIRMNKYRKSKVHLILFFIFLVSNIGGSLTPLGDPPLFLGFLNHVPFFWTFRLFKEMGFAAAILLAMFYFIDYYMFHKEGWHKKLQIKSHHIGVPLEDIEVVVEEEVTFRAPAKKPEKRKLKMEVLGLVNILFLLGIVGGVLFSGFVHFGHVNILGVHVEITSLMRDGFLVLMGLLSLKFTPWEYREGNEFSWFPIVEVAKLFAGIFMTMIPALAMLRAGVHGHLNFIIEAVKEPWHYFWVTGALSSFLDNAPTYLTFLNTALGQFYPGGIPYDTVPLLISQHELHLVGISIGAVFFGAMSYIGNAPNFMVRSIAEEAKISMPSFFGYMIYSVPILGLIFLLVTGVFLL